MGQEVQVKKVGGLRYIRILSKASIATNIPNFILGQLEGVRWMVIARQDSNQRCTHASKNIHAQAAHFLPGFHPKKGCVQAIMWP